MQDHHFSTMMMLSDRLRGLEQHHNEARHAKENMRRSVDSLARGQLKVSEDISKMNGEMKHVRLTVQSTAEKVDSVILWGRRILLSLGLIVLYSGNLTVDLAVAIAKKVIGL